MTQAPDEKVGLLARLHLTILGKTGWSALFLLVAGLVFPWAFFSRDPAIANLAWWLLAILGFMIFYTGIFGSRLAFASRRWPRVMAAVTSVEMETRLNKGRELYRPRIIYEFKMGGLQYRGDTVDYAASYTSLARAEKYAASLISGDHVMLSVCEDDPALNVIVPGLRLVHFLQFVFGLAGMIVPLLTYQGIIVW